MDCYIYAADLYCEECGEAIRDRIIREGFAPSDPDDEASYDSGDYPSGPCEADRSDSPQHCGSGPECLNAIELDGQWRGDFLENELTSEGERYVRGRASEELTECVRLWLDHYGIKPEIRGPITASFRLGDREESGVAVINPDGWFGKTWLIEIGCGYSTFRYIVEADSASDAIDEFSDSEFGHHIHVAPEDAGDYDEESAHYDGSGRMIDLDHLGIEGREGHGVDVPFECRYHADGLPATGIDPRKLELYEVAEA